MVRRYAEALEQQNKELGMTMLADWQKELRLLKQQYESNRRPTSPDAVSEISTDGSSSNKKNSRKSNRRKEDEGDT
jgi:hypothetical protein